MDERELHFADSGAFAGGGGDSLRERCCLVALRAACRHGRVCCVCRAWVRILIVVARLATQHLLERASKLDRQRVVQNRVYRRIDKYHCLAEHQEPQFHVAFLRKRIVHEQHPETAMEQRWDNDGRQECT